MHPSISADLLGLLDDHLFFMDYMMYLPFFFHGCCGMGGCKFAVCLWWSPILDECHPFLVDLDHAMGWVLQTCLLSWMIIHLGCITPSILVGIYHVMEWMLQICFLSQWLSNSDAYHPSLKDINHLWNGVENMLCILDDNSLLMKFPLFFGGY